MPQTESVGELDLAQSVFNFSVYCSVAAAGIAGLIAIILKHERPLVVYLSLHLLLFSFAMKVTELLG
jgi:hypothetical protein